MSVQSEMVEVLGGLGSREMHFVEHECACGQTTRAPLVGVELYGDMVWCTMTRAELRRDFADEAEISGIGHNNGGVTYMTEHERAGPHRMSRCGGCLRETFSIDEALGDDGPWWLTEALPL